MKYLHTCVYTKYDIQYTIYDVRRIYELRIKKYTIYAKCVLRIKNIRVYIFKNIRKDLYDIRNTIRSVFLEAATYIPLDCSYRLKT